MTESMILRVEAAIAEAVIETGDKEFASKLGLFLADHPGLISRAAIEAMMEPTKTQLDAMEPWSRVSGHHEMVWKAGVKAALIYPAGSADRAGVPLARD